MARQWRIEYEGALYHVLSRGNEGRPIVADDKDRAAFWEILGRMAARFEVEVLAYVLMNNHYHLLLKTKRGNLCKSLQWFGVTYTRDIAIYLLWEMGWYIRIVRLGRFLGLVIRR